MYRRIIAVLFLFSETLTKEVEGRRLSEYFGYHERIGIPKAKELLQEENRLRIVGGSQVSSASVIPYQAGIVATLTTGYTSICGGSLISNTRVLTAAHCWFDGGSQARQFTIVLGSVMIFSGGTRVDTNDVTTHSSWTGNDILYDIAMVRISSVNLSSFQSTSSRLPGSAKCQYNEGAIQPISLPLSSDASQSFVGTVATTSGYGKNTDAQATFPSTTSLYQISVTIMSNNDCQNNFPAGTIHSTHLCTSGVGGKGTCDGDSGGPLAVITNERQILVGVVSFGGESGCQAGMPSVFTRVTEYLNWIQTNM